NTPWLTPGEVSKFKDKHILSTSEYITDSGVKNSGANLLPEGSLLVTSRATLGARVINQVPMTTNQGFKSIVFKDPKDADYYFHFLCLLKAELERRASGTTFLEISGSEFSDIDLPVPPKAERNKITEILDKLDNQIRETEVIIAKLRQVKHGLLYDLLTRGVDENGELRPSYEDAPELYKSFELGWIPKDWNETSLGGIGYWRGGATPSKAVSIYWPNEGTLWVSPKDLNASVIKDTEDKVSDLAIENTNLYVFDKGTIVVVFRSGILRHSLPAIQVDNKFTVNQDIKALLPNKGVTSKFVHYFLQGKEKQILNKVVKIGTTVESIDFDTFKKFAVGLPPEHEQLAMSDRLIELENRLLYEKNSLDKLRMSKEGLMDDLLTGKVRVTDLIK
ncbi:restriction endonuclease subunit S, partial [Vibrio makurazakiensis]|uniref:restriction endonuclease subunit S n=1 Tax=Vibrio makurazakiensis TaxID=2910250 RepID=UPI003D0FC897